MKQTTDVLVIGGGIIGSSLAYYLRKRGVDVVVLDQGEVGKQASSAASGLLAPIKPFTKKDDPYTLVLLSCLALFPELVQELQEVTGLCIDYRQTGTLRLLHAKKRSRLEQWVIAWQQAGFDLAVVSADDILCYESGVATNGVVGLYNPHEPQLNAMQLMQAYAHAATMLGAIFYPGEEVIGVERQGARVTCVRTAQGQSFFCTQVIVATGAWSAACGEWLGIRIPVRPLRGQNLAISQPALPLHHILFGEGIYLAPKSDELLVVGTVRDDAGFATEITPEGVQWLCHAARKVVPALAACAIQYAWAGLLPKTPDARPILGAASTWDNVTLACGHNGFGLLLAPVGDLIAESIVSGHMPASLKPFGLDRFLVV